MIGRRRAVAIEWLAPAIGANPCDPDALFGIIRELTKLETVYGIAAVDAALRTALSPITAGTVARPWRYLDAACRNSPDGRGISMDVASAPAGIRARPGQRHSGAELLKTLTLRRLS